ncbi:hypothetical protein PYCCODRAFT_1476800 [Trametes coccinea BRFM310]|uniref:Uncharacterized protein n=1 Tax=Trametes coccinea (strain BRFM310) TaxID=1353009 RepID=A0A1Y2IRZ9_TRAC3|nr:hypothetical protein PYCCODRAFT_1476800 [Trametes coccinea BRFM310]
MQRGQDNESWNDDGTGGGRRGMGIQGGPEFNSSDPMSNQPQNPQGFRGDDQMRLGNDDNMNMNAAPGFSSSGGGGGGGQFGNNADPSMQGGDFSDDPMGDGGGGGGTQRASAGRDDNGTNFGSSAGPAAMSDGSGNNPSTGDKFMGSMQKAAGRVSGNANMVERGEMRKTGGPQADDTLL